MILVLPYFTVWLLLTAHSIWPNLIRNTRRDKFLLNQILHWTLLLIINQGKSSFWLLSLLFSKKIWIVYYSEAYYVSAFSVKLRVSVFFTISSIKLLLSTHVKQTLALSNLQYEYSMAIILLVFSPPQSILISSLEQFSVVSINVCWFFSVFLFFWSDWQNNSVLGFGTFFHSQNVGLVLD